MRTRLVVASALTASMLGVGAHACDGDLNGDGIVGGADLGALLNSWGSGGGPADLNGDGTVDGADLGELLNAWGDCPGVVIKSVFPPVGGPGTILAIEGSFPTDDPYDACVVLTTVGGVAGEIGIFAPIEVLEIKPVGDGQLLLGQIGPVPPWFQGEVQLNIVWGEGFPVVIQNPFGDLITLNDEGACWGDPQPGGANIIFNIGAPVGGAGACGPGWDASHVGVIVGGALCVTLPGGPGPNRSYPAGTKIEIWPRFHTCDGTYVSDFGTIRFELNTALSPFATAGALEALLQQEIGTCGPQNGLVPTVTTTPLGNNNFRICLEVPGHPVCNGNLVVCIDWP